MEHQGDPFAFLKTEGGPQSGVGRFHGVGLATDIVESSAKAMVHVLNNIWRAAEVEKELQRKAQHNENNKETV